MMPLLGLVMALAMLSGVIVVDVGILYDGREGARLAADLSALAGAQELPSDEVRAGAVALEYAALNGYDQCGDGFDLPGGCDPTVTVSVAAGAGYHGGACTRARHCVQVEVTRQREWLFGGLLNLPPVTVRASAEAQAGAEPRDVMVVIDRSGSMCADSHGSLTDCPLPPAGAHAPLAEPPLHFWQPFGPVQRAAGRFSRLEVFSTVLDRMGVASYSTDARLDLGLGVTFGSPGSAFEQQLLGMQPAGFTNMGGGICVALNELLANGRREALAFIILLSDGLPNRVGGPGCPSGAGVPTNGGAYALYMAQQAAAANIVIHTIGLGADADENLMRQIAATTGGQYFDANTASDLETQFEAVAENLGLALIR